MSVTDAGAVDSLVDRARRGSEEAFTQLARLYQARVRTYLDRFLSYRGKELVDDLAQEAFLTAFRSLDSYAAGTAFDFWLLRIAKHKALTYLRDEQRRHPREGPALEFAVAGWVGKRLAAAAEESEEDRLGALQECLKRLPQKSARLISEHYFRGRGGAAIAADQGKSQGSVWVTLLRIRQALRQCIELRLRSGEVAP